MTPDEIRALLDAAPKGPWEITQGSAWSGHPEEPPEPDGRYYIEAGPVIIAEAIDLSSRAIELIAAAPTLATLAADALDEVEALRRELEAERAKVRALATLVLDTYLLMGDRAQRWVGSDRYGVDGEWADDSPRADLLALVGPDVLREVEGG